jgi:hypothetical protein
MFVDLASFAFGHYADYIDGQTAGRSDGRRRFVDGSWAIPFYGSIGLLLLGAGLSLFMHPDRPFKESP